MLSPIDGGLFVLICVTRSLYLPGSWRVLSPAYEAHVFSEMLDAVVENDWDFLDAGIPLTGFMEAVDAPEVGVRQCCLVYGSLSSTDVCKLDPDQIAIYCAKQLLQER